MAYKDKEKNREYNRLYRQFHKEEIKLSWQKYYQNHQEERRTYAKNFSIEHPNYKKTYDKTNEEKLKAYHKRIDENKRKKVFDYYGWICVCCGETEPTFLTIDHMNNDGAKHRREIGAHLYQWLITNKFPPGFQTLCWNCNRSKWRNGGRCVHENLKLINLIKTQ